MERIFWIVIILTGYYQQKDPPPFFQKVAQGQGEVIEDLINLLQGTEQTLVS